MRNAFLIILLVLLALLPIAVWGYIGYAFVDVYIFAEQGGRKAGQAAAILLILLLAVTPAMAGGVCILVGVRLLTRRPWGARFTASVGIACIVASVVLGLVLIQGTGASSSVTYGAIAYVVVLIAVLVWLWMHRTPRMGQGAAVQSPAA